MAPPGRAARERGRPALCANVLDEFVRALLPRSTSRRGGPARGLHAPPGPNGLLRGRHVPPALLPPHRPLYPACRFPLSPALLRVDSYPHAGPAPPRPAPKRPSLLLPVETAPFFFLAAGASSASRAWRRRPGGAGPRAAARAGRRSDGRERREAAHGPRRASPALSGDTVTTSRSSRAPAGPPSSSSRRAGPLSSSPPLLPRGPRRRQVLAVLDGLVA